MDGWFAETNLFDSVTCSEPGTKNNALLSLASPKMGFEDKSKGSVASRRFLTRCPGWVNSSPVVRSLIFFPSFGLVLLAAFGATRAGAVTLSATEDSYTFKSAPTVVQDGTVATIQGKEASSLQGNSRTMFVKFSLAGVLPAEGDNATFSITTGVAVTTDFTLQIYAVKAGTTGFNWTESSLTWNTSPALGLAATNYIDTTKATALGGTFLIATGATAGTSYAVPFTGWNSYRQADDTITFIAVVTSQVSATPSLTIASSENTTYAGPRLTIVPEPAQAMLFGSGLLALLVSRRNRRA